MVFDPTEFLIFAERLVGQASIGEVDVRNSISRAYYAAFLYTRERLAGKRLFISTRSANDHGRLVDLLRSHADGDVVALGHALVVLRRRRNAADYDLVWNGTTTGALLAVWQARSILSDVDRLFP